MISHFRSSFAKVVYAAAFVEASTNNISRTITESVPNGIVTSMPTLSSCGACGFGFEIGGGPWNSEIYTYTAAVVELIIDDSTNQTSTSTVSNASFTAPSGVYGDATITGTVATEIFKTALNATLDAKTLYLTYPTVYDVYFQYSASFQTQSTMSGNGSTYVTCTNVYSTYTEAYAIARSSASTYAGPVYDALTSFTSSNFAGCENTGGFGIPTTKIAVSALTATSTRHVGTISSSLTPIVSPTVSPTVSSPLEPVTDSEWNDITLGFSGPVVHASVTGGLHPGPTTTEQPVGGVSESRKAGNGQITLPFFGPIGPSLTTQPSTSQTGSVGNDDGSGQPKGSGGEPDVALPITQSQDQGKGGSTSALPVIATLPGQITVGGQTYTADSSSQFIVGSQTLEAGGSAVTHSGHTLSLGPSASDIVIDSSTAAIAYPTVMTSTSSTAPVLMLNHNPVTPNSASQYVVGSQTLVPGSPAITISGTPVSLAVSAAAIVIGSSTKHLFSPSIPTAAPVLTIGNHPITANRASQYVVGSQTLSPGGPAITISDTLVSLAASASAIIIGSSTKALVPPSIPTAASVLTIGNHPVTANSASQFIVGSQTLSPGGPAITISGTRISLAPSATDIVIGTSTEALGSIIMGGFGPTQTAGSAGTGSANSTTTGAEAFTGGAERSKVSSWGVVLLGIIFGLIGR